MEEKKKLNFFQRFYMAIFKLEDYTKFFEEKWTKALKYFTLLSLLVAVLFGIVAVMDFYGMFEKGYSFFKTLPEFEYKNNVLTDNVYASGYDEEYSTFFVMNTNKSLDEVKEAKEDFSGYGDNYLDSEIRVFLYKDGAVIDYLGENIEFKYNEFLNEQGIIEFSKTNLINELESGAKTQVYIIYYVYATVVNFISIFVTYVLDIIMLAIFADIIGLFVCKVKIKFSEGYTVASYAVTLPLVITLIYSIVNYFTGFYMEYITNMTVIIEYVYIIAVMFMIKSDRQKMQEELVKVEEVHSEIIKEIEEKKEEVKENSNVKEKSVETKEETLENQEENNDLNEVDKQASEEG